MLGGIRGRDEYGRTSAFGPFETLHFATSPSQVVTSKGSIRMQKRELWLALRASLLSVMLPGCHAPRQPELAVDAPDTLASSLAVATRDFCVPYIVDGASVANLTEGPGVSEEHYDVNGKDVPRYFLDHQPGRPLLTFSDQEYCAIWLYVAPSVDRAAVDAAFRRDFRLDGRSTIEAHDLPADTEFQRLESSSVVSCVHGGHDALVSFSQSRLEYPIEVIVQSDNRHCGR